MALGDDGSFTLAAVDENGELDEDGEPSPGSFSEFSPHTWSGPDYEGGGINCEIDVYLRAAAVLAGSKSILYLTTDWPKKTIVIEYLSYGALFVLNEGTSTSTSALAEVQHESLWFTYKARTHVTTKTFDADGNELTSVNQPMWSYSLFTEDELETEASSLDDGTTEVKYFVKEKYAQYQNAGFWNVGVKAFDDHDPLIPSQLIKAYEFK